jgi:hypothetical protein
MTPNETLIIQGCVDQVKACREVCKQLLLLVQMQVHREAGISKVTKDEYIDKVKEVMTFATPIISIMFGKE